MRVLQFVLLLILVVQQSYQELPAPSYDESQEVEEPGTSKYNFQTRPEPIVDEWAKGRPLDDIFYNPGPDWEKEHKDWSRSVSVRSATITDNENKKRSVSVRSKAHDGDYDYPQEDKKRSISVRSPDYDDEFSVLRQLRERNRVNYGQEQYDGNMRRPNYGLYEQERRKQWDQDEQDEYSHVKPRSLLPGFGYSANDEPNSPLKQLVDKLQNRQSVPVTLREIHQIVRESQKQIWDQVVKMFPGGQLAQAMLRAQKDNLFAGLAFNPFKQNVKGTNAGNGLPGSNTIFPVPQPSIPGPWGKLFNPQQSKTNTESKQGGLLNPLGVFGSSN